MFVSWSGHMSRSCAARYACAAALRRSPRPPARPTPRPPICPLAPRRFLGLRPPFRAHAEGVVGHDAGRRLAPHQTMADQAFVKAVRSATEAVGVPEAHQPVMPPPPPAQRSPLPVPRRSVSYRARAIASDAAVNVRSRDTLSWPPACSSSLAAR